METPNEIPEAVKQSFSNWRKHYKLQRSTDEVPILLFDNLMGCYYFWYNKIFYGIELDGYLHT